MAGRFALLGDGAPALRMPAAARRIRAATDIEIVFRQRQVPRVARHPIQMHAAHRVPLAAGKGRVRLVARVYEGGRGGQRLVDPPPTAARSPQRRPKVELAVLAPGAWRCETPRPAPTAHSPPP